MGLMQRNKGKRFERQVAAILRSHWPDAEIRRASQADRAAQSDVYATGHPVLERLWLELQDAAKPTPIAKLMQAEGDVLVSVDKSRMPIAVTHKIHEQTIYATTRLWVLDALRGSLAHRHQTVVTLDLRDLIEIVHASTLTAADIAWHRPGTVAA